MINLWRGLDAFRGQSEISTWVYRIAVNTCLLWKRSKKRRIDLELSEDSFPQQGGQTIEEYYLRSERILELRKVIGTLKKVERTIALLLLEEMSYKEIAAITGLTVNNVGVKISRIKDELKKILR
jgi:RNA polymerase sigma-70 factor (ECF subfamily)